jgi:hypothetical protein
VPATTGQRNIFRQSWQKRRNISLVKTIGLTERASLQFSFDVFNVTNTPSFDIPIDDVNQNQYYNGFPTQGTTPLPSACGTQNQTSGFYNCPLGWATSTRLLAARNKFRRHSA